VQFSPDSGARVEIDGKPLLIEGDPLLFDHLAICSLGVWTREGSPGVENSNDTELSEAA
jgi:hypothetical protein